MKPAARDGEFRRPKIDWAPEGTTFSFAVQIKLVGRIMQAWIRKDVNHEVATSEDVKKIAAVARVIRDVRKMFRNMCGRAIKPVRLPVAQMNSLRISSFDQVLATASDGPSPRGARKVSKTTCLGQLSFETVSKGSRSIDGRPLNFFTRSQKGIHHD